MNEESDKDEPDSLAAAPSDGFSANGPSPGTTGDSQQQNHSSSYSPVFELAPTPNVNNDRTDKNSSSVSRVKWRRKILRHLPAILKSTQASKKLASQVLQKIFVCHVERNCISHVDVTIAEEKV